MKKLGILMAAAMILVGTATFAKTAPAKAVKATTTHQDQKPATEKKAAHKGHKKHHHKKASGTMKPAAPAAK